jgi:carboxyl-terminal processing protease
MRHPTLLALSTAAACLLSIVGTFPCAAQETTISRSPRTIDYRTCSKPEYPKADIRAEHTGVTTLEFLVAPDGTVKATRVGKSSGHATLDEAARASLAACRFTPAVDRSEAIWLPVQYVWTLDGPVGTSMSPLTREQAFLWAGRVLARYRYKPATQASDAGAPVLALYLEALDPDRVLFTRTDIADFEAQRAILARNDDAKASLAAASAVFEAMRVRQRAMLAWMDEAARQPLGVPGRDSKASPGTADTSWPASDDARQVRWRQRLAQEVRDLRTAGTVDKDIVTVLTRRAGKRLARVQALTENDAFDVFMNAYVRAHDPHGAYLPVRMRLAGDRPDHVGVGLIVQKRGEWITVREVAHGGSAERAGDIHAGDRIVGVAQGTGQPMTDVVGWSVDEVVALLRGAPGSTVVMDVRPADAPDGPPRKVTLARASLSPGQALGHATAKVEALDRPGGTRRIGIVTVPSFYEDFAAKRAGVADYASMTREVAGLLTTLKAQHVDAVLLDMRGNGGGSLSEASGLAGLFLPGSQVAQQRQYDGTVKVESTPEGTAAWEGPLSVLIDERSAAATEIFAAAMQDYGRATVIGDRSFGRSSVQTIISLDRFATNPSLRYGELKMTVAQVFRATGATFEQTGVIPDVEIKGMADPVGSAHQLAFPAAPLAPLAFEVQGDTKALLPALAQQSRKRMNASAAAGADVGQAQLREALQVAGDPLELVRARPVVGR